MLDLDRIGAKHIIMIPDFSKISIHVFLSLGIIETKMLLDENKTSLVSSIMVNPELWLLSNVECIVVAAAAIATTLFTFFPEISLW